MSNKTVINFRCKHRHSAVTHPHCYLKYIGGKEEIKLPKILLFDIETAPLKAFVFQKNIWKADISDDKIISEWFTLCWSAKWLFDDYIISECLTKEEVLSENDSRIVTGLWKLMNESDIVIAHNGDSFDVPNMNTRFVINGLLPPRPYKTIDTKTIAKKQFGFTHNSLNALARLFGLDPKIDITFELWKQCVEGNEKALKEMEKYNQHDVELLERIYLRLRPWIRSHPNLGLYMLSDGTVCPNCGSKNIVWVPNQYYYTGVSRFPIFRCDCGAYGRSRKSELAKKQRDMLVAPLSK
jgi:hypothetical protein